MVGKKIYISHKGHRLRCEQPSAFLGSASKPKQTEQSHTFFLAEPRAVPVMLCICSLINVAYRCFFSEENRRNRQQHVKYFANNFLYVARR